MADHWNRLLDLFFQNRPGLSPHKYHLLGQITQALANGLRKVKPSCGLSPSEVLLIGQAAVFCDIGLLGIPDDILLHGPEQGGSGQNIYFQHTTPGHALFTTGPSSAHPLARYAAEIAYCTTKITTAPATPWKRPPIRCPSALSWYTPHFAAWIIWNFSRAIPTVWTVASGPWPAMWGVPLILICIRRPRWPAKS